MGEVELGGKHAGGSPRRRGTFRDSTLIGTATSTFAAGPVDGDAPARGSRRAAGHNGPRAALTTTIAAGVVAVATGSVAYSTALQPLAGTSSALDRPPLPQAAAPAPGPGRALDPADRPASDGTRHPRSDAASPITQGEHPSRPLPAGPGSQALPAAPPSVPGAPFEFTNPLLPGPSPVAAAGAQLADPDGEARPVRPEHDAAEAVAAPLPAAPPTARDDDSRYPVRSLPVLVEPADEGSGAAATADDRSAHVPAQRAPAPAQAPVQAHAPVQAQAPAHAAVQAPAPQAQPAQDRTDDPHYRTPTSVADWFARLTFRDPPPDPFTADPQSARPAAPADRTDDATAQARSTSPEGTPVADEAAAPAPVKFEAALAVEAVAEGEVVAPAADGKALADAAAVAHDDARPADQQTAAAAQHDAGNAGSDGRSGDDKPDSDKAADHQSDDDKAADTKADADKADADKAADTKSDDHQPGGDDKAGDNKAADDKAADSKAVGDNKPGDHQPGNDKSDDHQPGGDDKAGDTKLGDDKPADNEAAGENKPGENKPGDHQSDGDKSDDHQPDSGKSGEVESGGDSTGSRWTSDSWFGADSAAGGGFGSHR
jgi:hypothetical protein